MKDFYDFLDENHITPENTPCSDYILLKKAYRRDMKSQESRISRLSKAKKELESVDEDEKLIRTVFVSGQNREMWFLKWNEQEIPLL